MIDDMKLGFTILALIIMVYLVLRGIVNSPPKDNDD